VPIDLRLALAQQVEVGPVEDVDKTAHEWFSDDVRFALLPRPSIT
jgi:hypothetical protein